MKWSGYYIEAHRSVIKEYASQGYRFVGFVPTISNAHSIIEIDLVFEKEVETEA